MEIRKSGSQPSGQGPADYFSGSGWVQKWGEPMQSINPGDGVSILPGEKHWQGASTSTAMSHTAIQEKSSGVAAEWMEKVSNEKYGKSSPVSAPARGCTASGACADRTVRYWIDRKRILESNR